MKRSESQKVNQYIWDNFETMTREELAAACNISWHAVRQREKRMGLHRDPNVSPGGGSKAEAPKVASDAVQSVPHTVQAFVAKQVQSGALVDPDIGPDGVFEKTKTEWADTLEEAGVSFTRDVFDEVIDSIVWTTGKDGTLPALDEIVKRGLSLRQFHRHHGWYIPKELVARKARERRGETKRQAAPAEFLRGINRIGGEAGHVGDENFEIPTTSSADPLKVEPSSQENWRFMHINAANLGIKYDRRIESNPLLKALSSAERLGCDAVCLTNTIDVEMKKAGGPLRTLRALVSGREINTALMDPTYQEEAERILRDMPDDELIYETANEAFEDLMNGWYRITHMPNKKPYNGRPVFSGNIYVVFGYKEEAFVVAAAHWAALYFTAKKQAQVRGDLKIVNSALARAKSEENTEEVNRLSAEQDRLIRLQARLSDTNVHPQERERVYPAVLAHVIRRFEESIPNCKVISMGGAQMLVGSKRIDIDMTDNERVTDTHLSHRVKAHGPQTLREELADAVIVCPPWPLNEHATARERDAHAERGHAYFAMAPMCVDGDFLRRELGNVVRKAHPLTKVVASEQFQPGVLLVECIDGILLPPQHMSISALEKYQMRKKDFADPDCTWGKRDKNLAPYPNTRYIYYLIATDIHMGSRNREAIWSEEAEARLGMVECFFHLMRRDGLLKDGTTPPIHFFSSNDDFVQGNHFETHQQPHVHELSYLEIEDEWNAMMRKAKRARSKSEALKHFADMRNLMLYQLEVRGLDWTQQQVMEVFERLIEPNLDAFDGILQRAKQSGLKVRPISEHIGVSRDSRDIGAINCGTGNHFLRTLDKKMVEGPLYADKIRSLLQREERWRDGSDELKRLVKAPLDGNVPIGYGTIQIPRGYEWGIDLRDTPPGSIDWHDPLRPTVTREMGRGNPSRILEGKMSVRAYGDKHFFSFIMTPWSLFLMGPPGTHTDVFGDSLGFPPNNTGVIVLGLPVDGPDGGPILLRSLLYDDMKELIEEKRSLDWEHFFPNPA